MRQALSDIVVAELAEGVAGSYCGKVFADLGAEVVKVERAGGAAGVRRAGFGTGEGGARGARGGGAFLHLNTNKRSVALGDERAALDELLGTADLVIETPGPGSLAGWGTSWAELHARRPELVVLAISGFGADGPYAGYRAEDLIVQAMSGTMLLQNSDQPPLRLPGQLGEYFTGSMAAVGALGALALARATGRGAFVDCAAVEALASMPSRATMLLSHQYRGGTALSAPGAHAGMTLIPTGVFPCADGYMAMMSTPQQLNEMLDVLDNDDLRAAFARPDAFERGDTKEAIDAALYPWLFSHTRAEATAAAQKAGWPLAGVNSTEEVLAADHLHQRGFWVHADDPDVGAISLPGPAYRFAEGGWALRRLAPALGEANADGGPAPAPERPAPVPALTGAGAGGRLPLEGVRVVDLTTVWAGPYATMLLADLGAEVVRVENPWVLPPTTKGYQARPQISNLGLLGSGYGPVAPGSPDRPWNRHALNNSISRNKLSCTIDTRRPEGRELLMRLVEESDLFVENFKANGLARMGIQVSELQARNPRLVILRLPPTGLSGDWSPYTGFGTQFDGLTGLLWVCGHRDSDLSTSPPTTYMDAASGPSGAFAAMAALHYRDVTGRGQVVELAQSENVLNHLGDIYVDAQLGVAGQRMGNRDRWRAPQGLYRCQGDNRWLAISVGSDREWEALAGAMGQPRLATDARFATVAARRANHDLLDGIIGAWAAAQDAVAVFPALQAAGVPAAPLMDETMFCQDPHIQARGWMRPLATTDVGTHLHPSHPYRGVPEAWRRGSPALGEDNEYVYKKILGVSDADLDHYREAKILADAYLDPDGNPY